LKGRAADQDTQRECQHRRHTQKILTYQNNDSTGVERI